MLSVKPCLAALLLLSLTTPLSAHPNASARIDYLDHQIETKPLDQTLLLKRAWLQLMDGQYELARADIVAADNIGSSNNSLYLKGLLHSKLKQTDQAIRFFNDALKLRPNNTAILEARAQAYSSNNQSRLALDDYHQILKQSPAPNPSHYLSTAKLANSLSGYRAALNLIDEGIEQLGLNPQLQQYAIQLSQANSNYTNAIERHLSLAKMMQTNPAWYLQHADLLIQNQQYTAATEQLQAAEKLLKNMPNAAWVNAQKQTLAQLQVRLAKHQ